MTFNSHPELPGFPTHTFDVIHKEHYYFKNYTGRSSRHCELSLQFRTVPRQTIASIREDLARLLAAIKRDYPAFNCTLEAPAVGTESGWNQSPMECPRITRWFVRSPQGRRSPQAGKVTSVPMDGSATLAMAISSRRSLVFRPFSMVLETFESTRNGQPPTNACFWQTW
jgi:hypothetical protein